MPRTGRGGARTGTPGKTYENRTDLQKPTQAVTTAPGQGYGQAAAQASAQRAIPLPGPGAGLPSNPGAPGTPTLGAPGATPQPAPQPGALGPITAPTNRPNEPITAGMPMGPGPGPEVLAPPDPLIKAAAVLNQLGSTADPATAALRLKVNATLNNRGAA